MPIMRKQALGLPYMGSKKKLAGKIVSTILKYSPETEYIYDLFGGGGAISFEFMKYPQIKQVFYNELNTGVVELLKKIQKDGVTKEFYKWVSREDFNKNKNRDDWIGGLTKVVWSFANNQKGYMYSKKIEEDKKILHEIIVDKNEKSLKEFNQKYNTNISMNRTLFNEDSTQERRLFILSQIKKQKFRCQHLESLQHLERFQGSTSFNILNKSYKDVKIITPEDKTIIYCDPPYEDTSQYQEKFNIEEFKQWVKECPYKIFVSSYSFPLQEIASFEHRCTSSATQNQKVIEKLFYKGETK